MTFQDYHARAELYLGSDRHTAMAQGGRSFATTAQALRFAFEEAAPVSLHGAMLKIGDRTITGDALALLYRSAEFPLTRKADLNRPRSRRMRRKHTSARHAPARSKSIEQVATTA